MRLDSAQGYFALGMRDDAWAEVNAVAGKYGDSIEVCELSLSFLLAEQKWEKALKVSQRICEELPDVETGYIHAAYCQHELGDTPTACDTLRGGPASLSKNPLYHYNLGCYYAVLGDLDEATDALRKAFKLDAKLADMARDDPDLASVREVIDSLAT
jgi:tetratricopeptide (TPR) repeat protein